MSMVRVNVGGQRVSVRVTTYNFGDQSLSASVETALAAVLAAEADAEAAAAAAAVSAGEAAASAAAAAISADEAEAAMLTKADIDGGNITPADGEAFLPKLYYADGQADDTPVDLHAFFASQPLYGIAYGVVPDGTDRSAQFRNLIDAAIATGREIVLPPGTIRFDSETNVYLEDALSYSTSFRKGLRIRGAGSSRTVIDSRVANGWWLNISVGDGAGGENSFASFAGILGGYLQGLTIRNGAVTANSNGFRVRAQYQFPIRDVHVYGLSGTGIKTRGGVGVVSGDFDSCNMVSMEDVRVENCGGWGIDTGNDAPFNENSFTTYNRVFVQNCGTSEAKSVTGVSQAANGVVTCVGHGFTNGQKVFFAYLGGMSQLNTYTLGSSATVTVIDPDSFSINVNTSGFTAYTSGGIVFPSQASSGGIRLRGQIGSFYNCGLTINKNRSIYVDGNGGGVPQDIFFYSSTIENPHLIGFHVQGGRTILANGLHVYTSGAASGPVVWGHLYDGESSLVSDIDIRGACIRTTSHVDEADLTIAQSIGANVIRDSVKWDTQSLQMKQFGANNQRLFRNINERCIPQQCRVTVLSTTSVAVRPDPTFSRGDKMPLRLTWGGAGGSSLITRGPWVEAKVAAAGVTKSNSGLAASTLYYVYFFTEASGTNAQQIEFSTTAPVLDETGYPVKTGEPWKLCCTDAHGVPTRVRTDAGSLFATTGSSFCAPTEVSSDQVGVSGLTWVSTADRKLYYKSNPTLPTAATAGEWSYWPSFETGVAYDPPSLAAGAETTVDVTVVCAAGDFCTSVGFSTGWGGLVAFGSVKAANTITAYIKNPTAGVIDLASGTIRTVHQRR